MALREAVRRGDGFVGSEHLVLGFLHPETGAAGDLLRARGLTLDGVRTELEGPGRAAG
jgi:Clp amino terminal domain, pathogenicity island component